MKIALTASKIVTPVLTIEKFVINNAADRIPTPRESNTLLVNITIKMAKRGGIIE
jgi:hypothetical protein